MPRLYPAIFSTILLLLVGCQEIERIAEQREQAKLQARSAEISAELGAESLVLPAASETLGKLYYVHVKASEVRFLPDEKPFASDLDDDARTLIEERIKEIAAKNDPTSLVILAEPGALATVSQLKQVCDEVNLPRLVEPLLPGMKFHLAGEQRAGRGSRPICLSWKDPPRHAQRYVFECSDGRITFLDISRLDQGIQRIQSEFHAKTGALPSARQLQYLLNNNVVGDGAYRVTLELDGGVRFVYRKADPDAGELLAEMEGEASSFRAMLNNLEPQECWFYFVGRESSFDVLRYAMRDAADAGFAFGWDAMPEDEPIVMSSGGSRCCASDE
ncbi:MAG: hypothetical protein KDA42_15390 [Planctomycetales bacterium]|nr:hypothetical protein [Planctomycetales bacterium]